MQLIHKYYFLPSASSFVTGTLLVVLVYERAIERSSTTMHVAPLHLPVYVCVSGCVCSCGTETMLSSQLASSLFPPAANAISPVQPFECHICHPINSKNNNNGNNTILKDNCAHKHTHVSGNASVRACCAKSHSFEREPTCKRRYSANMRTNTYTYMYLYINVLV